MVSGLGDSASLRDLDGGYHTSSRKRCEKPNNRQTQISQITQITDQIGAEHYLEIKVICDNPYNLRSGPFFTAILEAV